METKSWFWATARLTWANWWTIRMVRRIQRGLKQCAMSWYQALKLNMIYNSAQSHTHCPIHYARRMDLEQQSLCVVIARLSHLVHMHDILLAPSRPNSAFSLVLQNKSSSRAQCFPFCLFFFLIPQLHARPKQARNKQNRARYGHEARVFCSIFLSLWLKTVVLDLPQKLLTRKC